MDREKTESLCPICLARIPAHREVEGDSVFLRKQCPEHGESRALVWRGPPAFGAWKRPKIPAAVPWVNREVDKGCPFDCGLCPDHRQRSCTVIMEVTQSCNLHCPVCYADSVNSRTCDPDLDVISTWYQSIAGTGRTCNLQLSGGEPTMRDDLPEIVAIGRDLGFPFIQVNTNGIRLGHDPRYLRDLERAGVSSVFLQFDGTEDDIHLKLRGRRLLEDKRRAVEACGELGIGVVLVPTIVPGINDRNIGEILAQALKWSPVVRAVHFQPVSYFGRYPHRPGDQDRMTLPDLMRAIERQTGGRCRVSDFRPPGCENALCSFHGSYLVLPDGALKSLQQPFDKTCCPGPESAEQGATTAISYVARQWSAPASAEAAGCCTPESPSCSSTGLISLDDFVTRARTHTLSVSAMAFQDAWTLDLERVRDCCIHVFSPERGLVPFCLYNLTDAGGCTLYRQQP